MPFDGVAGKSRIPELDRIIAYARERPKNEAELVLKEALRLIERGWCRRSLASTCFGFIPVPRDWKIATRYCARGAILRAALNLNLTSHSALAALGQVITTRIVHWNDRCRSKEQVIAGFQRALKLVRREGRFHCCAERYD